MSVISLVNYAGNSKLPDDIIRSLVTRSTDNASLSELARAYGYTEGPAVGVAVNASPDTGETRGRDPGPPRRGQPRGVQGEHGGQKDLGRGNQCSAAEPVFLGLQLAVRGGTGS